MKEIKSRLLANSLIVYTTILGFFGFIDSLYLTIVHYKSIIPPCTLRGCEKVLDSSYAMLGPIPVALLGVIFYVTVIIICLLILIEGMKKLLPFLHLTIVVGLVFSIILFYIQFAILESFCQYCLLSELISAGLFVLSLLKFREDRKT